MTKTVHITLPGGGGGREVGVRGGGQEWWGVIRGGGGISQCDKENNLTKFDGGLKSF